MPALIDVSFLLLIFFMVSATLQRQEADLRLRLPDLHLETHSAAPSLEQMRIQIGPRGDLMVNREPLLARSGTSELTLLEERLARYAAMAMATRGQPLVVVQCADEASEQRFIDVLNSCSSAGIEGVSIMPHSP